MKFFTTLFFILFISTLAFSQTIDITGKIADADSKSFIDYATIILKTTSESKIVTGTKSKNNGAFIFENINPNVYSITFSSIGYETTEIKNISVDAKNSKLDLGIILLSKKTNKINEVVIEGKKQNIELQAGKIVFNVEQNITSAGGVAEDILKNVPGVNVDVDGGLSMRGKDNITLLVDGKQSAMFGSDVATALQNIPAASIESIEVINNPGAKYESQGIGGIINIILKKDKKRGMNGSITLGGGFPYQFNSGFNFNATTSKKWNHFINANFRDKLNCEDNDYVSTLYSNGNKISSKSTNDRTNRNIFINFGNEFSPNDNNKFTLTHSIFSGAFGGFRNNPIQTTDENETLLSKQKRTNDYIAKPSNYTANLKYNKLFKDKSEKLNVELNYSIRNYKRESVYRSEFYNANDSLTNAFSQEIPVQGGNWNGTFQVDYQKDIAKNTTFEIGERTYYIKFHSENFPTITYDGQAKIDETKLKNNYVFSQQIHALYSSITKQFKSTSVQIGLRGEYFQYQGDVIHLNKSLKTDFKNLFPTLFLTQKINKQSDLTFSYGRRVNRPNFFQLIPFIDVTNPLDTSVGNPDLKPEFIHSIELNHNFRYGKNNNLISGIYFQYTENLIQQYRRFNENGTTFSQNQNLAFGNTVGVELTNRIEINKNWDMLLNLNAFRNEINGSNLTIGANNKGFGAFAKFTNNLNLGKEWSTQLTANYNAPTTVAQGTIRGRGNVDLAVKKSFLNKRLSMTASVNDIFNTQQTIFDYNFFPVQYQTTRRKNLTRFANLQFTYKLFKPNTQVPNFESKRKKNKDKEVKSRDENLKSGDDKDEN